MGHLERALEWLRGLILGSKTWDYCVIWRLGDDPSRFIEWVDCCCNGGENQQMIKKRIKEEQNESIAICRDTFSIHPANTKACEALSRLPSSLSLYSGIHGEVVISSRPKWLNIAKTSDSETSNENSIETQVLIPVVGGLVELFSAKHIPEDERIIEFVKAQFNFSSELEMMSTSTISFDEHSFKPSLDKSTHSYPSAMNQPQFLPWSQPVSRITHGYNHPNLEGSSTNSFASDEHTSPDSNPCPVSPSLPINICGSGKDDHVVERGRLDSNQKPKKENCKSKNLLTERNRRARIKGGMFALRALVPNITKMDKAAILGDAIDYIKLLENQKKELEDELMDMENEDSSENAHQQQSSRTVDRRVGEKPNLEVQVNVNQLGPGHFLLRIKCQRAPGAFTKLLENLESLGIHMNDVKDANVTTCNDMLSIILTVQTNNKEIQEKDLRESLTKVTA